MKKAALAAVLIVVAVVVVVAYQSLPAGSVSGGSQSPERVASGIQSKIDIIKKADADKNRRTQQKLEVSEAELAAYVLVVLRKDIPFQMDSIHVRLTPGSIAADTRLTLPSGVTGNVLVDALVSGTHDFYVKGKMRGTDGMGRFDLQEVTVDRIPVPHLLIDALVKNYLKPKYPEADLKAPFDLPWGIDAVDIGEGKATITY